MKRDWKWLFFSAEGRLNRKPYILATLGFVFLSLGGTFLDGYLLAQDGTTSAATAFEPSYFGPFYILTALITLPLGFLLAIKRSHDRDRSGWFSVVLFVPLVAIWPLIEFVFLPGTNGPNRFGDDQITNR